MTIRRCVRVLCVDDHAFLVDGLAARFDLERDIECVGRLESAEQLISQTQELRPDVVLLDIEMPGPDPFEAVVELLRLVPDTRVVFLSAYVRDHYISAAVAAGAHGYFSKSDDPAEIIGGLRTVARKGEFAFGPKVLQRCRPTKRPGRAGVVSPRTKLDDLTARELEILRLIGRGMSRTEIGETLCRSPKTIDGHREKIMHKLDIHDRAELVRYAIREGLVEA